MFHQVGYSGEYDGPKQNAGTKWHKTLHVMHNISADLGSQRSSTGRPILQAKLQLNNS